MQSKTINDHELVKICMTELCAKAGFPPVDDLVQRDLVALCDLIESKTGVLISLSTVKRLLNGQFSRLPQIATLDAIAVSAGYQNWRDFTLNRLGGKRDEAGEEKSVSGGERNGPAGRRRNGYIVAGIVVGAVVLGALFIMMSSKSSPGNIDKAHFSATKVTGNDIPNTVIFKYNVDSVSADSFFIQQSWDKGRRVRVYKHQYTLTDIYYEPGYHNAKLIADDKIIRSAPVSIPTDKWLYYAMENAPGSKPKYITLEKADSGMGRPSINDLLNSKVDIQKNNKFCQLWFPSTIEYTSDSFTVKFRVRIKGVNNESCPQLMCEVFCQNNFMYFTSTLKGCTSELRAQFGENELDGGRYDLSPLGADLREWRDMEFSVSDKKVQILIDGKNVFSSAYTQSAGLITGIGFISNGLCEVEFVDLKTTDGRTIYASHHD